MPGPDRLSIVAPLPPDGPWRRALALDRGAGPPRRVVLSFVPASVLDDAERLAALVRDVEAAGRLHHPGAVPVLGTETLDDQLAVVEPFRPAATVRALLEAAGRLPPDVAARIVVDACAAVARAHAIDAGEGRPLVHGGITPSRLLVGEDGAALVCGFGAGGGGAPEVDVRALAAVLFECLAGEPPRDAATLLQVPGIPPPLAEAVVRALGSAGPASAAALAQAVAGAGPLASHADVAAYADIVAPSREAEPDSSERAAEEVAEDLIVEPTEPVVAAPAREPVAHASSASPSARAAPPPPAPDAAAARAGLGTNVEPTFEPLPRPPATRPGADPAGVFAAPAAHAARRSRMPLVVAAVCLAAGFAGGYAAARAGLAPGLRDALPVGGGLRPDAVTPAEAPPALAAPAAVPVPEAAEPAPPEPRAPSPAPARSTAATRRAKATKAAAKAAARPAAAKAAAKAAAAPGPVAKGFLDVTAPAGAEVLLDGRRVGVGGLKIEIPVGRHHVEVRLGDAKVEEAFDLGPGETWTYAVTPAN